MRRLASDVIRELELRVARLEGLKTARDPRSEELVKHILNNNIQPFTQKGNLAGRAGEYFYPIHKNFLSKNPPASLYLSGKKIALMTWNGKKWETYIEHDLKPFWEEPRRLNRWIKIIKRKVENPPSKKDKFLF